jgi:hypothetical protein
MKPGKPQPLSRSASLRFRTRSTNHQGADARKGLNVTITGRLAAMAEHKFKIGQLVYFQLGKRGHTPPGPYQIVRRLPESDGEFHYVIRSTYEDHERVAREGELTRV